MAGGEPIWWLQITKWALAWFWKWKNLRVESWKCLWTLVVLSFQIIWSPTKSNRSQHFAKSLAGFPFNRSVFPYFLDPPIYQRRKSPTTWDQPPIKYSKKHWFPTRMKSSIWVPYFLEGPTNTFWKKEVHFNHFQSFLMLMILCFLQEILPEPFQVNSIRLPEGPLFRLDVWRRIHNTQRSLIKQTQRLKSHPTTMFNGICWIFIWIFHDFPANYSFWRFLKYIPQCIWNLFQTNCSMCLNPEN